MVQWTRSPPEGEPGREPGDDHEVTPGAGGHDATARSVLLGTNRGLRFGRRGLRLLPASPRCKLCHSPFTGAGGFVMRRIGKAPWPKNPKYCSACFIQLAKYRDGAEIPCSLLFADVRGSTALAETMAPAAFRALMNRFFDVATEAVNDRDGVVDKYVGDEIIGIFIPAMSGEGHAADAIAAAQTLVARAPDVLLDDGTAGAGATTPAGAATPAGLTVGAGVNTGIAYVGAVGSGDNVELTAMGDPVNVTARLAAAAGPGEILVTAAAAEAAMLPADGLERRTLELKGKTGTTDVVVLRG